MYDPQKITFLLKISYFKKHVWIESEKIFQKEYGNIFSFKVIGIEHPLLNVR